MSIKVCEPLIFTKILVHHTQFVSISKEQPCANIWRCELYLNLQNILSSVFIPISCIAQNKLFIGINTMNVHACYVKQTPSI